MDISKNSHYSLDVESILNDLTRIDQKIYLFSYSVLDRMFLKNPPPVLFAATEATLIDLAKTYAKVDFPGMDSFDACLELEGVEVYVKTVDSFEEIPGSRIHQLTFLFDIHRSIFIDRSDAYYSLRNDKIYFDSHFAFPFSWREIGDIAVLTARYHYQLPDEMITVGEPKGSLAVDDQRIILTDILTGKNAHTGLDFLMKSGFIQKYWPELTVLNSVEQSKEYHPEGNVWEHTLAALSQRKTMDLSLALGILLHDIGKTESQRFEGNQFHQHAQIGSYSAVQFLRTLGYPEHIIERVRFLVQYHMLPAAIDKIPPYKTEHVLTSANFPLLLELFRCDMASSSRNLSKYYNACKFYRRFMKNRKNPFKHRIEYSSLLPKSV